MIWKGHVSMVNTLVGQVSYFVDQRRRHELSPIRDTFDRKPSASLDHEVSIPRDNTSKHPL
jgi:hypothetical protein